MNLLTNVKQVLSVGLTITKYINSDLHVVTVKIDVIKRISIVFVYSRRRNITECCIYDMMSEI